ncbi:MAG: M3 family metallopeptidase [Kiritimatiellae bacterium]|nr:M3 family metallopeptidase [Kiritimatiellia bacterium]
MKNNPFYKIPYHPEFDRMTPADAETALKVLLKQAHAAVDQLLAKGFAPTWEGLIIPLEEAGKDLGDAWGLLNHMLSVMNNDEWRCVQESLMPEIIQFSLRVGQSKALFQGYCDIRDTAANSLSSAQTRILNKMIQGAEHAGVALEPEKQEAFNQIQMELGQIYTKFSNNILDATKAYSLLFLEKTEVAGLPRDLLSITAEAARDDGHANATAEDGPWKITLDYAVYGPFLKHSRNRAAREQVYRAAVTKASAGKLDNHPLIDQILEYTLKAAQMLGYRNHAELSLAVKMTKDVQAVYDLNDELSAAARPTLIAERSALLKFARSNGFEEATLQPWDIAFWSERQREQLFDYSEEELSRYFPFPKVLDGMFKLAERIFNIHITLADGEAPLWHKDVRFFRVSDENRQPMACFYLDPYSRPATKRGGAWMNEFRTREKRADNTIQLPMAVLVCNQSVPVDNNPSLMRFGEVITLFHEFGHALQHMLTTVDEPQASGINGIEWDAVEIASQFMENWCYERRTVKALSSHVESAAEIPDQLFDKIIRAKNYHSASAMMRQLFLGATDMDLYAKYPDPKWADPNAVKLENAEKYAPWPLLDEDRFLCSFSHIFGGGYAAGYFSYKWSEVLSADAFAAFEEAGLDDPAAIRETGLRLRGTILGLGGGTHPMEAFKAFRGREPSTAALLRHSGLN